MALMGKDAEVQRFTPFMAGKVEPMMGELLHMTVFDPKTETGELSCEGCHTLVDETGKVVAHERPGYEHHHDERAATLATQNATRPLSGFAFTNARVLDVEKGVWIPNQSSKDRRRDGTRELACGRHDRNRLYVGRTPKRSTGEETGLGPQR
jgi:hypothetical protein